MLRILGNYLYILDPKVNVKGKKLAFAMLSHRLKSSFIFFPFSYFIKMVQKNIPFNLAQ